MANAHLAGGSSQATCQHVCWRVRVRRREVARSFDATICIAAKRSGRLEAKRIAKPEADSAVRSGADGRPRPTLSGVCARAGAGGAGAVSRGDSRIRRRY